VGSVRRRSADRSASLWMLTEAKLDDETEAKRFPFRIGRGTHQIMCLAIAGTVAALLVGGYSSSRTSLVELDGRCSVPIANLCWV
jgi:hypothetical protein